MDSYINPIQDASAPGTQDQDNVLAPAQPAPRKTLKAVGIGFLIADAALFTAGVMAGKLKEASGGVFGWIAGVIGTRYGNPKAEKQLEQLERKFGTYLRKQGVEIPKDPTTESLNKEGGVIDHIESFLYSYPSQMMNVFYSLVGVQFARSGIQHKSKDMMASGALLIAGALGGILIQEKKPDPKDPPKGMLAKLWSWIQEKPLRLTGTLFTANQFFLAKSAFAERRANPAQKSYMFKLLAVASFVFGNTMMALSSKSHGGGHAIDEKTLNQLAETSAHVILAQPQQVQDALLEQMAGFLASQPNINLKAPEISELLHKKITEVAHTYHPPATEWQERMSNEKSVALQPAR